jgi:DNA-binding CsgD family transcriptional regulator
MVQETITNSDVRLLDEIVRVAAVDQDPPGSDTLFVVLDHLAHLVPFDAVGLQLRQVATLKLEYCAGLLAGVPGVETAEELTEADPGQEVLRQWYWRGPWSLPERRNRLMTFSVSQVYSQRQWQVHPVHLEYFTEFSDQLATVYHTGSGRWVRLLGFRRSGRFSERELLMLELLRPHLAPFMLATVRSAVVGDGRTDASPLTPRQIEVMRMVQSGLSNKQIGKALDLSTGTVRKHMENAHRRLGVQNRTAAVGATFGWAARPTASPFGLRPVADSPAG